MNNTIKYYIHLIGWSILNLVVLGPIFQAFLIEVGLSEESVNVYLSFMQVVQILTMIFFSKIADNIKNIPKVTAFSHILDFPFLIFLFLICFGIPDNSNIIYTFLFITGGCFVISIGIYNVLSYKLPYHVMDMKEYGRITSIGGIFGGIFIFLFSILFPCGQNIFDFFTLMKYIFAATIIITIFFIIITNSFKENKNMNFSAAKNEKVNIFKYKPFVRLIIPNVLRGFCLGIVNMSVSTGYYAGILDSKSASWAVVIANFATILGNLLYSKVSGKIKDRYIILFSSIIVFLFLPMMLIRKCTEVFLVFYAVVYFFIIIINIAIPVTVTKIISYSVSGEYSAWRMLLNTVGTSLAGFFCIALFRAIGIIPTLIISGAFQLISGIGYYNYLKNNLK